MRKGGKGTGGGGRSVFPGEEEAAEEEEEGLRCLNGRKGEGGGGKGGRGAVPVVHELRLLQEGPDTRKAYMDGKIVLER